MLGTGARNEAKTRSRFLRLWCDDIEDLEDKIIATAEKLEKNSDILTAWAKKRLEHSMNEVVKVRLNEGVIINPAEEEEVSVVEVMGPNEEDAWYRVNLEKCTCGCTYWQSIGIACKHAVAVWRGINLS